MDVNIECHPVRDIQLADLITEITADLRGVWSCLGALAVEARAGGGESDGTAEEFLSGAVGRLVTRLDTVARMVKRPPRRQSRASERGARPYLVPVP